MEGTLLRVEEIAPLPVALYVLWGARCRETREKEREKRLHSPFALHAPIQWARLGYAIKERG